MRWSTGTLPTDFTYTGQRADTTGLMYYHARYYHPALGRFVSADTVVPNPSRPVDLNRYAYAANSPLRFVDPSGHAAACSWGRGEDEALSSPPPPEHLLTPGEKMGLVLTGGATVVAFSAAEISLAIAGVAAADAGPVGIAFDVLVITPIELFLVDVEVAIVSHIYRSLTTGEKQPVILLPPWGLDATGGD